MMSEYLEHHGVKGMHWGKWNAETAARYSGSNKEPKTFREAIKTGLKTRVTDTASAAKSATLKRISGETRKEARSRGYDKVNEYKKARKKALYSHNPETVAKYASTLTDTELENKLKRLRLEKQITELVPPKTKSTGQQALDNFTTNFASKAGNEMAPVAAKFISKKLGINIDDSSKYVDAYKMAYAKAKGTKEGSEATKSNNSSSNKESTKSKAPESPKSKASEPSKSSGSSISFGKNFENSNSESKISDSKNFNITLNFGGQPVSDSTKSKGSSIIKSVSDQDVIDVKPVSASSEAEARHFLRKFKNK